MLRALPLLVLVLVAAPACCAERGAVRDCGAKGEAPGKSCYEIDEPRWNPRGLQEVQTREMRNIAPVGSVRPPPDCSVGSPGALPAAATSQTSPGHELPPYLMSDACLISAKSSRSAVP
jgi:hypothetical protein